MISSFIMIYLMPLIHCLFRKQCCISKRNFISITIYAMTLGRDIRPCHQPIAKIAYKTGEFDFEYDVSTESCGCCRLHVYILGLRFHHCCFLSYASAVQRERFCCSTWTLLSSKLRRVCMSATMEHEVVRRQNGKASRPLCAPPYLQNTTTSFHYPALLTIGMGGLNEEIVLYFSRVSGLMS